MFAGAKYPSLVDRSVLITGGATGIGAAMVEAFSKQGAKVGYVDIDVNSADLLNRKIAEAGLTSPWFREVDVTHVRSLQATLDDFYTELGAIDTLINNVANDQRHDPLEVTEDSWRACLSVNLDSAFFASQRAIGIMRKQHGGSIINLSSINALIGPARMPGYVTAKAALLGLTKALARDFGEDGIRVNAILPGWVSTERQRQNWLTDEEETKWLEQSSIKRCIIPQDVADLALFLASDHSQMITNQHFVIDGGRT